MTLLPRIQIIGTCVCEPDGEYEGRTVQVFWLGWVFEVTLARWEERDAR